MSLYHCYYDSLRKPHSEKLYPQFLRPFLERFYLQSIGFTNRVVYRFFPLPFPIVSLGYVQTRIHLELLQFNSLLLSYVLRVKCNVENGMHKSNGIIINFPTNFPASCDTPFALPRVMSRLRSKKTYLYSTVVQDRLLRSNFAQSKHKAKTRRETVPIVNRSSISRGQS